MSGGVMGARWLHVLAALLCAAISTPAMAVASASSSATSLATHAAKNFADPAATSMPSPAAGVAQSLVGLMIVLAVLFAAAWLVRRFNLVSGGVRGELQVEQALSVGGKERVVLLRVRDQHLLLGVSSGQVTLLKDLGNSAPTQSTTDDHASGTQSTPTLNDTFKDILKRSLGLSGKAS